jgi:hypothetical protein
MEARVAEVLDEVHRHRRLARLIVTRDLGFEPTAEVLHAIVRLAAAEDIDEELVGISRRFVALAALADQVAGDLLDADAPDSEQLRLGGLMACEVMEAGRAAERRLLGLLDDSNDAEREFLLEIASCLPVERDDLLAAALIAPRLERMIDEVEPGDREVGVDCRARLNAIALETVFEDDLCGLGETACADAEPSSTVERARTDLAAYRVISDRLQERQEAALSAGLSGFAAELRRTRGELYATYLSLCDAIDRVVQSSSAPTRR